MTITTEQFITVNVGGSPNDGTGDNLRNAFIKVNQNFANISDIGFDAANINVMGTLEAVGNVDCSSALVENTLTANVVNVTNNLSVAGNVKIGNVYTPSANNSPGVTGQITWDSNYVYICVSTDQWKRANLPAW